VTTVAFRDGFLAADTAYVSASSMLVGFGPKIERAPTGDLLAVTGFAPTAFAIRDWWLGDRERPQPDYERIGSLIVFRRDGEIEVWCSGAKQLEAKGPFYTYGSGQDVALGLWRWAPRPRTP